jgi:hypothetical protein
MSGQHNNKITHSSPIIYRNSTLGSKKRKLKKKTSGNTIYFIARKHNTIIILIMIFLNSLDKNSVNSHKNTTQINRKNEYAIKFIDLTHRNSSILIVKTATQ